jgi:hypothetical protein
LRTAIRATDCWRCRRQFLQTAKSLNIPDYGEILVFQEGVSWVAVHAAWADVPSAHTGSGPTILDAVANLIMAE